MTAHEYRIIRRNIEEFTDLFLSYLDLCKHTAAEWALITEINPTTLGLMIRGIQPRLSRNTLGRMHTYLMNNAPAVKVKKFNIEFSADVCDN